MATLRRLVQYGYLPLLFSIGLVGIVSVSEDGIGLALVGLLLLALGASFGLERILPYEREWNRPHSDSTRDIVHALVNESLSVVLIASLPVASVYFRIGDGLWPGDLPFGLQVCIAVIVADVGITLTHYASHRFEWLWRFHAVHHSVKRMYGLNGLMKHPLHQMIETLGGTFPLVLVGMPLNVAALLAFLVALQLMAQHSNVDYAVGPLRHVLAVSPVHRFHHLNSAQEGDVNFGLFTTLVDHLLGTYHYEPSRRFRLDDLGIEAEPNYPAAYRAQLLEPFRNVRRDAA